MRRRFLELACVLAAVAGCAKEEPSKSAKSPSDRLVAAQSASDAKEWKAALAELDLVIADPKATGEEKSQAWADKVFCATLSGGEEAGKAALKSATEAKADFTVLQYFKLGNDLADEGKTVVALEVVAVATNQFKGDKDAEKKLRKLAEALKAKGVTGLESLGYTGSNPDEDEEEPAPPKKPDPAGGN